MLTNDSFFNKQYKTPRWLSHKLSRRSALKSAAGAMAIAGMPIMLTAKAHANTHNTLSEQLKTDPWLTLDSVINHLLPASPSGPSAAELQVTLYLFSVVNLQPTKQAEIDFIYKGVGWLNGYTQSQLKQNFIVLSDSNKEKMLRAISQSSAGDNWINNLINYLYEAMLAPPIYGGNPNGIGWKWLEHQAGFPLPKIGNRYYELPGQQQIEITQVIKQPNNRLVMERTKS